MSQEKPPIEMSNENSNEVFPVTSDEALPTNESQEVDKKQQEIEHKESEEKAKKNRDELTSTEAVVTTIEPEAVTTKEVSEQNSEKKSWFKSKIIKYKEKFSSAKNSTKKYLKNGGMKMLGVGFFWGLCAAFIEGWKLGSKGGKGGGGGSHKSSGGHGGGGHH